MAKPKLPPNMTLRQYVTKRGVTRARYYCRYTDVRGIRRIEALGSTLEVARERYHEIMRAVERGEDRAAEQERLKAATFSRWAEDWLALTQHKDSHDKDIRSIGRLVSFFGSVPLTAITTDRIEAYKAKRRAEITRFGTPTSPALVNRELAALRSVLVLAQQSGMLAQRPALRLYREQNERDRVLSLDEYHRLLAAVLPRYRPAVVLLWEIGAREGEVCGLTWSCVNFARKALTFTDTKTAARTVPMNAVMEATLRDIPRQEGTDRVFDFSLLTFKDHVRKRLKKLGMTDVWTHDLRRSFITRKQLEGWDYRRIMLITGHKDLKIFTRYNKPSFEDLRSVLEPGNTVATQPPTAEPAAAKH